MTYVRRKRIRKPKDLLVLALRDLLVGEDVICTSQTHEAIKDRVDAFYQSRKDLRFAQIKEGPTMKIKRVA